MLLEGEISDDLFLISVAFAQDNLQYDNLVHERCDVVLSILGARRVDRGAGGVSLGLGGRKDADDDIVLNCVFSC